MNSCELEEAGHYCGRLGFSLLVVPVPQHHEELEERDEQSELSQDDCVVHGCSPGGRSIFIPAARAAPGKLPASCARRLVFGRRCASLNARLTALALHVEYLEPLPVGGFAGSCALRNSHRGCRSPHLPSRLSCWRENRRLSGPWAHDELLGAEARVNSSTQSQILSVKVFCGLSLNHLSHPSRACR